MQIAAYPPTASTERKMSPNIPVISCYLLVDNGLLQSVSSRYDPPDNGHPEWLEPLYKDEALAVSPLIIDLGAAYESGQLDRVMELANAQKPALHLSLIETPLTRAELAQHLRRFIFIVAPNGKQYTMRFADCAVITALASILAPEQWRTMTAPLLRWGIHDRSHSIAWFPSESLSEPFSPIPLQLTQQQIDELNEALAPEHVLATVRAMRRGRHLEGDAREQQQWACAARAAWQAAGNENELILTFFANAVLATRGEILRSDQVPRLLQIQEHRAFSVELRQLLDDIEERRIRLSEMAANVTASQTESSSPITLL
jgi:hypothetical protein